MRTGASLDFLFLTGSSPQTGRDSSQGSAIVTPRPRSMVRREKWCVSMGYFAFEMVVSVIIRCFPPSYLAELATLDNQVNGGEDAVVLGLQLGLHFGQQRLVGKLHATPQGVAEELLAELADEGVPPGGEQIFAEAVEPL